MMPSSTYLKTYPYLFVKESDQNDYFCTICDTYLKDNQHQSHLFDGHAGETLQDYFVRVNLTSKDKKKKNNSSDDDEEEEANNEGSSSSCRELYICVVCWAKLDDPGDMTTHRSTCKLNLPSEDDGASVVITGEPVMSVVSTPDLPYMDYSDGETIHGECTTVAPSAITKSPSSSSSSSSSRRRKQTAPQQHIQSINNSSNLPPTSTIASIIPQHKIEDNYNNNNNNDKCFRCSLCSTMVPSMEGYAQHLEGFHRVATATLESPCNCPLCMASVYLLDLSVHLTSIHGLVPQTAVNSLILWVLTTDASSPTKTFFNDTDLNDSILRAKTLLAAAVTGGHQTLLQPPSSSSQMPAALINGNFNEPKPKLSLSSIVTKFSRSHVGPNNKQSFQCCLCSKWFAVPPIKHMRTHILKFKEEKRKLAPLIDGHVVCLICYNTFDGQTTANVHLEKHNEGYSNGLSSSQQMDHQQTAFQPAPINVPCFTKTNADPKGVELDNAGRVKSGKVRKQCELCGQWSNIKWFFKHMSEVHQALFCRCCREYLPISEQEDHRRWHAEPPYMGQKIRIENGQPIIIDRKERASLTPIGSLAPWGGSSGGMVVKAVDDGSSTSSNGPGSNSGSVRKRKNAAVPVSTDGIPMKSLTLEKVLGTSTTSSGLVKDTLMPKETCPVCGILITYKNLARHIKLRHKIKYKFCHKCRKLVPNNTYEEHKAAHTTDRVGAIAEPIVPESDVDMLSLPTTTAPAPSSAVPEKDDFLLEVMDDGLDEDRGNFSLDTRKTETFRANTSKTKLESLLGKEFKHPRRKCALCGYSVSYSNFKRHLRNAHPTQYQECENNPGAFKRALATLAISQEDESSLGSGGIHFLSHPLDDEITDEDRSEHDNKMNSEDYTECKECGDHILEEFLDRHMKMNHPEETNSEEVSMKYPTESGSLNCPVCNAEMKSTESVLNHCKTKHKIGLSRCGVCSQYVTKKTFSEHQKSHQEECDDENFSTDDDGDEDEEEGGGDDSKKVMKCGHCNKVFFAQASYELHIKESHPEEAADDADDESEDNKVSDD